MIKKMVILIIFVIFSLACVTTDAVKLGTASVTSRPPVPWDQVKVYRTADQVPGKYEEIALLVATGDAIWTSESEMWKSLQKKAGKLGANAIILDAMSEPSAGAKVASAIFGVGGAERKGKAIAIYVYSSEEQIPEKK